MMKPGPLLLVCVWLCGAIGGRATAFFGFRTSDTNIQRDRAQGLCYSLLQCRLRFVLLGVQSGISVQF